MDFLVQRMRQRAPELVCKLQAPVPIMLFEHEQKYGLGMDASGHHMYALGTRTELFWFGHGCSGLPYALGTRTGFWFGHGCCGSPYARGLVEHAWTYGLGMDALGHRMLLEHDRNCGLSMDVLGHPTLFGRSENALGARRRVPMGSGVTAYSCMYAVGNRTQRGWVLSWSPYGC